MMYFRASCKYQQNREVYLEDAKNRQEPPRTAETQILRQQALNIQVVGGRRCPPEGGFNKK